MEEIDFNVGEEKLVASNGSNRLMSAVGEVSDRLQIKYYHVQLDFVDPE